MKLRRNQLPQLSKGVLGLQRCVSAGLRVHMQLETIQFSQRSPGASGPSHQVCPAVTQNRVPPKLSQLICGFCCYYTQTHRHRQGVLLPPFVAAATDRHWAL